MENFLPKAAVLAVVAGGFSFTGDLGWLASKGLRVLNAADVAAPSLSAAETPVEPPPTAAAGPAGPPTLPAPVTAPAGPPSPLAPAPVAAPAPVLAPQAPASVTPATRAPVAEMKPPAGGLEQIAWTALRPGDRVIVWLAAAGHRCLVLDVVDPATGEALAYEVAAVAEDGRPLTAVAPPSRVVVGRPAGGTTPGIVKGDMMHIAPAGIATAGETVRQLGPVEALALAR